MIEKQLREYLKKNLSEKRFRHSESAGRVALELCRIYHLPVDMGLIAGLGHDIARETEPAQLLELALSKFSLEKWEMQGVNILHGKAGAALLQRDFGINDAEILEAVAWHTTGIPGMGDLAKIVYIADYIEPNRKHVNLEIRTSIENLSLHDAFMLIVRKKMEYLKKSCRTAAPPTEALYKGLEYQRLTS